MTSSGERPIRPYGSWPSPISVEHVVAGSLSLRELQLDGDDVYWIEGRPEEGGRSVVVRRSTDGTISDVTPAGSNARTMVHEYGGGSYAVNDELVVYADLTDGRLRVMRDGRPVAITPEGPFRYADLRIDPRRDRVVCIREDHTTSDLQAESAIVGVPLAGGEPTVLFRGPDFISNPRPDPGGDHLAWLTWSHPDMPWDASELWLASIEADGSIGAQRRMAGGTDESIAQPEWAPDGSLVFCSDRTGWWNLYRIDPSGLETPTEPEAIAPMEAEFADPQWVFGQSAYAIDADGTILASARSEGRDRLYRIVRDGTPVEIEQPFVEIGSVRIANGQSALIGVGARLPASIVLLDAASGAWNVVHRASEPPVDDAYMAEPRPISFASADGRVAHAIYYAPTNPDFVAPVGERPPLIVLSHGGPTSSASAAMSMETQFFTSRGFAVVDVDYGGSTGYGRAYRKLLDEAWGVVDVEDCTSAAEHLAEQGLADGARMFIRGGSAGGYTTLRALTISRTFSAGSSHYGVGDLEGLARDTHKFESRYLDRLVGPYPEAIELYRERSPIHAADRIACPVIVFQGLDDAVVPPAQAEELVAALERNGLPYTYLTFAGEGHGFRRAENIAAVLRAELSFFSQLFGFELADAMEPVPIANLERWAAGKPMR